MKKSDISPMPPFFDRYINMVDDIDITEAFGVFSPEKVYSNTVLLTALGDLVYAPGKWTVKDILQHVIDTERIMAYRALRFSRNDETMLPGFEEDLFAANTIANQRTVADLLVELSLVRESTILLFRHMSGEMMQRSGTASKGKITALALGYVIIGHAIHHMNVIRERYFPLLN